MFGRRKKTLSRSEKLQLTAAHAAGLVRPHVTKTASAAAHTVGPQVSRAADLAVQKVGPHVEKARDYAAPRASALAATAAVALAPRLETARRRSWAALNALRGAEPVIVRKRRRWPVAMGAMGIGMLAGAAARAFAKPMTMTPVPARHTPTVIPSDADVVVLDDVSATAETAAMPTHDADV